MPKGIYDRSKARPKTPAIRPSALAAPVAEAAAVGPLTRSGRLCSACHAVRPASLFAPSGLEPLGILNFVCRLCDGSYVPPLDPRASGATAAAAPDERDAVPPVQAADHVVPLRALAALPLPTFPDPPVVIPARASVRVEKHRQPDGRVQWVAFADGQPVGGGSAPDNGLAEREAWHWIAEHRQPTVADEGHRRAAAKRAARQPTSAPELDAESSLTP